MVIDKNLQIAIETSLKAGKEIMQIYNDEFNITIKEDNSPLTEADKKSNQIINFNLKKTNIPIISEENKKLDYYFRKKWNSCWIVDPIDGTKEFINGNGEFTVNIALIKNGKPEIGVVYVPAFKKIYYADVKYMAAFKATVNSNDSTLEDILSNAKKIVNKNSQNTNVIKVVGSRSHMNKKTIDFIENLSLKGKKIETVYAGSSLKFCLVAEGIADIYPRFSPTMEWDTAAGHAICSAVGLKVISKSSNKSLLYNKKSLLNNHFMVGL